jgi:chaperonin GroES
MFRPLNCRILIKPDKLEKETASGIIIATKNEERPVTGLVILDGEIVENGKVGIIKKGDRVIFSKFGYDEVEIGKELYYVVSSDNILGIF